LKRKKARDQNLSLYFLVRMKIFIGALTLVLAYTNVLGQDKRVLDSLKQRLVASKEVTDKVSALVDISWLYTWTKPDTAILYAMQARELAQQSNQREQEVIVSTALSEALCLKGNFSKAMEINLKSLELAEKLQNEGLIQTSLIAISGVYYYSGDYQKALDVLLKDKTDFGKSVLGLAGDVDKIVFGLIGEAYFHLHKLDSSLYYINKSYELDKIDKAHWSVPYYYMALIQTKNKKYDEALDNYRRGIRYSKTTSMDIANGYTWTASLFNEIHKRDSAIYYAIKAIKLAQKESLSLSIIDASSLLSELYSKVNADSAFHYQRIMLSAKDSLFSQEKVRQLQNLTFNEQLRLQEIEQEKKQLKNQQRMYALISGLAILLLSTFFLWRNNRQKQRAYALLALQKKELDIQKTKVDRTLAELKATQSQLIQSEKMASLGELTAGIAHEIQNPLNFINNFSEINKELLGEMRAEIDKENYTWVKSLSNDIELNQEKINNHGKRADAIVKGMLQHSQSSAGTKEPTDINKLADEYLRLAYHGLRAKDKTFNVTLKTDFDEAIKTINVVPQDIGRVILNLINNAFYAVDEKRKQTGSEFEPRVTVTTKKTGNVVLISIKDNGNGIPRKVLDKIFQPFFTTKPAGQGTGLGLSLSYDTVKAHSGELKVETIEGKGSEFIIQIPLA